MRRTVPDVFWIPSGTNSFPGPWGRLPVVTTFHDLGEYRIPGKYDPVRMFYRKRVCIPLAVRRSTLFTAVSRFTADDIARFLGLNERVRVVMNGPSPHAPIVVADAAARLREKHGLAGRFFFVPGRTDYTGKGLDLILTAYERQRNGVFADGAQLVFVGPPGDGHSAFLAHLARVDDGHGRVRYLGRVDDETMAALYQECTATILPSRFEGFGFPVLEAMDRGVPVLCSDAGSLPEVAGGGALLFRTGDIDDLCRQMARLASDFALRDELVRAARGRSRFFSWAKCAQGMIAAFEEAVRVTRYA